MVAALMVAVVAKLFRGLTGVSDECHKGISIILKHDEGQVFRC